MVQSFGQPEIMAPSVPRPAPTAPPPLSARERVSGRVDVDGLLVQTHLERLGLAKEPSPKRPLSARKQRPGSAGRSTARSTGNSGFRAANAASATSTATGVVREHQQLLSTIEREYSQDLRRIDDRTWIIEGVPSPEPKDVSAPGHSVAPSDDSNPKFVKALDRVDVSEVLDLPCPILDALLAGKCRDSKIAATSERKRRFAEYVLANCAGKSFSLEHSSLGPEAAKAVVMALVLCSRFTTLNLSCNGLGDEGAGIIGLALKQCSLLEVDLSANDISSKGATTILENLKHNATVQSLDLSSKPGALRNRFVARANARPLEELLQNNRALTKFSLCSTGLGPEGASGLARGLVGNTTLLTLDLGGCDIGSKGAMYVAEALRSCGLEELNLSDNRIGDEGFMSLANALGALPLTAEEAKNNPAWLGSGEAIKAASKYIEALSVLKRAIQDVDLDDLQDAGDAENRKNGMARVREAAANLIIAVRAAEVKLPRLKVLNVANSAGTSLGLSCLEGALQANTVLERLNMENNDHRRGDAERGIDAIIMCLAANSSLRHLNLGNCNLSHTALVLLSKALAANKGLCTLSLCGNVFDLESATFLAASLAGGAKALKLLNLSSCHLDDATGAKLAAGLATNRSLETLLLRNNCLHEGCAVLIAEALQRNTTLTCINLELNSLDMKALVKVNHLLARNAKIKEKALPDVYRARIAQLQGFERDVELLQAVLRRNHTRKRVALWKQAAKCQELIDAKEAEKIRQQQCDARIEELTLTAEKVEEEIEQMDAKLWHLRADGEMETNQLRSKVGGVEDKIKVDTKALNNSRQALELFESQASAELRGLQEELDRALKGENSAELLASAAQRNLDSFSSSLKAVMEDIAGGDNPRQRFVEDKKENAKSGKEKRARPRSRPTSARRK